MVKVTFEIKSNILFEYGKKVLPVAQVTFLFAMRVIGDKQFFKVGLNSVFAHHKKQIPEYIRIK